MQDSLCHGPFHCRAKIDTSATRSSGHIWVFSTAGAMETLQNDQRIWPNVWLRSIFTEKGETGWRTCGKRSCSQRMHLACSSCRLHVSPADGTAMQSMRSSTTSAAPSSLKSRHQMHRKIPSEISDSTVRALRGFCVSRNGDQISFRRASFSSLLLRRGITGLSLIHI